MGGTGQNFLQKQMEVGKKHPTHITALDFSYCYLVHSIGSSCVNVGLVQFTMSTDQKISSRWTGYAEVTIGDVNVYRLASHRSCIFLACTQVSLLDSLEISCHHTQDE